MTTTVKCAICGIDHTNPCADLQQAATCPINSARRDAVAHRTGLMPDPNQPLNEDHLKALEAAIMPPQAPAPQPEPTQAPQPTFGAVSPAASNPHHYSRFKIQPLVFIRENELPFWAANVIKYVCREDAKNGVEDIEKSIDYLLKERAYLKGDPNWFLASLGTL